MIEINFIWDGVFPKDFHTGFLGSGPTIPDNIKNWCTRFSKRDDVIINLWVGPNCNMDEFTEWRKTRGIENLNLKKM